MSHAVLFDTKVLGERFPGVLSLSSTSLVFSQSENHDCELGFDRLACRTGGVDNRTVYFSHPDCPGIEIVSHDFTLLESPPLSELPIVQAAIASSKGYRRRYWSGLALYGCLILVSLGIGGALVLGLFRWVLGLF